jgi:hypothetical protein
MVIAFEILDRTTQATIPDNTNLRLGAELGVAHRVPHHYHCCAQR